MFRQVFGICFLFLLLTVTGCATRAVDRNEIAKLGTIGGTTTTASDNRNFSVDGKVVILDPEVIRQLETGTATKPAAAQYQPLKDTVFLGLLQKELDDCRAVFDEFGSGAHKASNWEIGIASVGIIAGSIIVPALAAKAAAKSAIAAWGGVAGAANAAQFTLNAKGRSYEVLMLSQRSLNTSIRDQMKKLMNVKTPEEGSAFIYELYAICKFPITERPTLVKEAAS